MLELEKKIVTRDQAVQIVKMGQKNKKCVVFTNGCFDVLHAGHVTYLNQARALGDYLVLGMNSDASVTQLKGPKRPLVPQQGRAMVLAALACVDLVVVFDEPDPIALISALQPDIHVKGGDYQKEALPEYQIVCQYGGRVEILPFVEGFSTTQFIQRILDRYCAL